MTDYGDATDSVASASSLYFHLKTVGSSFTSFKYNSIRVRNSCFEVTRIPRSRVRANFPKNDSTRLSHDPCLGVKTNSNRLGTLVRYARFSRELCPERLSNTMRLRAPEAHSSLPTRSNPTHS